MRPTFTPEDGGCKERLGVEELQVTLQSLIQLLALVELLERRDHGDAEADGLHTLEVEGTQQEV